jgi:hypothetical protein
MFLEKYVRDNHQKYKYLGESVFISNRNAIYEDIASVDQIMFRKYF